jgi:hypothetical protein
MIALREQRPYTRPLRITGLDGVRRHIVVTALPLIGQNGRDLGAVAVLWPVNRNHPPR